MGLGVYFLISARRSKRALAETSHAIEEQVVVRERAMDSELPSRDELARIMASVSDCLWSIRVDSDGMIENSYISPVIEQITG